MPLKKISFKTLPENQNQRLDDVLVAVLPDKLGQPLSKGKVRKLIVAGAVYLNKKRVRIASKNLLSNALIEVFVDLDRLQDHRSEAPRSGPFVFSADRILFEDPYLIIVNKPPGLPTQPTVDEARDNLFAALKKFLAERDATSSPDSTYLGLHHRLDRDTSGAILFTKAQEANKGMAENFAHHRVQKVYQALALAKPNQRLQKSWAIKNFLGRLKGSRKRSKFGSVRSGGDLAETHFALLGELPGALWVEAKPLTGRTHQIRVHLSESGMPILGDLTYGGPVEIHGVKIPRLLLHAASLTFPHPIHNNRIAIECVLPGDFKKCLEALQRGQRSS